METVPEIRELWDLLTGAQKADTGKQGMFYANNGGYDNNNTFKNAVGSNSGSTLYRYTSPDFAIESESDFKAAAAQKVIDCYADIKDDDIQAGFLEGLNEYFNLLPSTEKSKSGIYSTLSRKEFMALVYRAETPVQEIQEDEAFTKAVGKSAYNKYAQNLKNNSYLSIENGDLDATTYDGDIRRAEAIYMIVNRHFRDKLSGKAESVRVSGYKFVDTQDDNGNVTTEQVEIKFTDAKLNPEATENTLEALNEAFERPDTGMPKYLYATLLIAAEINLIDMQEDTRWDEPITKNEALQLLADTYRITNSEDGVLTANTEKFVTKEQQEEADLQAAYDSYKKSREKGEAVDPYALMDIMESIPEEEAGDSDFYSGYDLKIGEDGVHYLKSVIDGHEVHIGEKTDQGLTYKGELNDCREDAIYWYRSTHPNTDMTDDEIASYFKLD